MFRYVGPFEKSLENATSHLRLEPDWPSILVICDEIRQNDVTAKYAVAAIKKKMSSPNPHTAFYALLVLESIVKNCGSPVHDEISTKENCEMFTQLIESTQHENVKSKMLELIQAWAFAFRTGDKYQAVKDTMTILKTKGHKFPELKEADAMFTSDTAPDWSDGKVCHRCRVAFTFTQRKHHCRNCGQIFCSLCSAKTCTLPKYGIEKEVRVCEGCYATLRTPNAAGSAPPAGIAGGATAGKLDSDLPAEYLASSLAQQSQSPPRKTEQELKEEEELQLALALSQSEAEQKNRLSTNTYRPSTVRKSPSPEQQSGAAAAATYANLSLVTPPATLAPLQTMDEPQSDPELSKYLNRDFWEQRKTLESPASPSAPSPMSQTSSIIPIKNYSAEDVEIDEFSTSVRTQVEIFVNRVKSNSSRGRNIATDSSVQTLFSTLTTMHARLSGYIKEMDDKRMWFEQLQDKLQQMKDSRAALDVLRQEHQDKLRAIAEEQERQRQMQMAHKLEIMRKKKQEYLQYQRQLALQRIQEQEREMQLRQEQQKALYQMGGMNYGYMQPPPPQQGSSPLHGGYNQAQQQYGYGNASVPQRFGPPPDMYGAAGVPPQQSQMLMGQQRPMSGMPPTTMPGVHYGPPPPPQMVMDNGQQPQVPGAQMNQPMPNQMIHHPGGNQSMTMPQHVQMQQPPPPLNTTMQQQQHQPQQNMQTIPTMQQQALPQMQHQMQSNIPMQQQQPNLPPQMPIGQQQQQMQQPAAQGATPPVAPVEQKSAAAAPTEPAEAELICFD